MSESQEKQEINQLPNSNQPMVEEQPQPMVEEQPQPMVEEQPQPVIEEKIEEKVEEKPVVEEKPKQDITITIDRNALVALSQNLNTNLIVNITAYTTVLDKLKTSETDETRKNALDANIKSLNQLKQSASELLTSVQTSLDVPKDKLVDAEAISKEVPGSPGSNGVMNKIFSAEIAAILGTMTAATVVMLGGAKQKKTTKRRRNKGRKMTKRIKE
jgi:hypothetical protein